MNPEKMPQVRMIANNLVDMVAALPAMKLDKLYHNAFICEAILRSLPPLAKKYVLRMLFPVNSEPMEERVLPDWASTHRVAVDRLVQLRIFNETRNKEDVTCTLNPIFQTNLKKLLVYGVSLPRQPMTWNVTSSEELEAFALEQWECFLLRLINSSDSRPSNMSSSMMRTLRRGLVTRDGDAPRLTQSGFQFLMMNTNAQLWYVIREYITSSERERGIDSADLIAFLLELSFHATGEAYNMKTMTEDEKNTIKDLADLGLVKLEQGRKESWFIPTKLATNLLVSLTDVSSRKHGFVVVETNFRLYAYSSSRLQCEILGLFARVEYQLPNLIVGAITKESLYGAFENGITAEQIISFLQQNAHPHVAERVPSVPENVTDLIRLWEADHLNMVDHYNQKLNGLFY